MEQEKVRSRELIAQQPAYVRKTVIFALPLKVADLRTVRILGVLVVGLRHWARFHRTRRGALGRLELHLCAARNELRTLYKSEHFAIMRSCAGTAYKM